MEIVKPPKLVPGKSIIGIIAPSGIVEKTWVKQGLKILIHRGYSVKLGSHILRRVEDWSAGTEKQRFQDFLRMIYDREISAIFCAIGGFAATEILPLIGQKEAEQIRKNPKIMIGYSDISVLLNIFASLGVVCFHGPNLAGLPGWSQQSQEFLFSLLEGKINEIGPEWSWVFLKEGKVTGRLLVSNLDGLVATFGTKFDPLETLNPPIILALEEVKEAKSRLVRWLDSLKAHRSFAKIGGIILGRFVEIVEKDYPRWGKGLEIEKIFLGKFVNLKLPIAVLADLGHAPSKKGIFRLIPSRKKPHFLTLPIGIKAKFQTSPEGCHLTFLEKAVI